MFCGSRPGANTDYINTAEALGKELAMQGYNLVYGGGSTGLMGATALAAINNGGKVIGIIPKFLKDRELMLEGADEMIVTEDMHERKMTMFQRSDAFIVLPGGIGTLEEVVEQMTWAQLGRHNKPIILVDINDFWSPLIGLINHMREEQFIPSDSDVNYHVVKKISDILSILKGKFIEESTSKSEFINKM